MKYLMRIAALEKENQKMNDQIDKYRRENSELLKYDSFKKQIEKLQYCIE